MEEEEEEGGVGVRWGREEARERGVCCVFSKNCFRLPTPPPLAPVVGEVWGRLSGGSKLQGSSSLGGLCCDPVL